MIDGELLELAAQAAGYHVKMWRGHSLGAKIHGQDSWWNPLTDDGDALRLAVKLNLLVNVGSNLVTATDGTIEASESRHAVDIYAATRRAIVRAAAEIGKAMEGAA